MDMIWLTVDVLLKLKTVQQTVNNVMEPNAPFVQISTLCMKVTACFHVLQAFTKHLNRTKSHTVCPTLLHKMEHAPLDVPNVKNKFVFRALRVTFCLFPPSLQHAS